MSGSYDRVAGTPAADDIVAEMFRVSDLLRGQSIQRAITAAAARAVAGSQELGELVRRQQDLTQQEEALYRVLLDQLSAVPEQQLPDAIGDVRKRIVEIGEQRAAATREIEQRFPTYANFVNPKPPTVEAARHALNPDESLVSILTTQEATYVWAIPKSGNVLFHRAPVGEREVATSVAKLRASLDFKGGTAPTRPPAFDVALAQEMFSALLKPVLPAVESSRTLYIAVGGSLAQIPLSVLVETPSQSGRYEHVGWLLSNCFAIAQLPSVNALVTLRDRLGKSRASRMFTGFPARPGAPARRAGGP